MTDLELLIACIGVVAFVVWAAGRVGVPYPTFLVLAGLGIGFIPGLPELELDPDVIFLVFLPPLIHAAAWLISHRQLRDTAGRVSLLALGNVAVSMLLVAVAVRLVLPDVPWDAALVLGAVLAPTDTVAATATFRRLGVPERITGLVEGESLINDGAALVAFRVAVAAVVTGSFNAGEALVDLLVVGIGGAAVGLAFAWVIRHVRRRLDDPFVEITVTLLTPYIVWVVAEELGVSGILAAVASGLYLGWQSAEDFTPSVRLQAFSFWLTLVFILESTLFILIGVQFPGALEDIDEPAGTLFAASALVVAAVLAGRIVYVMAVGELLTRIRRTELTRRERLVVAWSGMRGAVSLAAALAVPLSVDAGGEFPARDLILFLTLVTIGATLMIQGLTLPWLVAWARMEEPVSDERAKALARFRTVEAALAHVNDMSVETRLSQDLVERAREMYTERARQLSGVCRAGVPERESDLAAWTRLRRELLRIERAELIQLRNTGQVPGAIMREVERDLDLEEERLARVVPAPADTAQPAPETAGL